MAIISGYTPAERRPIAQPWQLPFNEMYTALKDKQVMADTQAAKSDELFATLASMQNFLPEDLVLHKERMDNIMQKEQALREQVGEDLTRPEYRQGLRKLIMSTATDPFYSAATQNFNAKLEQDKLRNQLMLAGKYEGDYQEKGTYKQGEYQGAVSADGAINLISDWTINPTDTFAADIYSLAESIRSEKYGNYSFNSATGFWENKEGERLPEGEIVSTLKSNLPAMESTSNYKWHKQKWDALNPNGTPAEWNAYLEKLMTGAAKVFDINDLKVSMMPGQLDGTGTRRGSDDEENIKTPDLMGLEVTVGDFSTTFESPDKMNEYVTRQQKIISKSPPKNAQEKEENVWFMTGGIHDLENKIAKDNNYKEVSFVPEFDADNDRFDFTISAINENGDVVNVDKDSKIYKDNFQSITNLKAKYEAAQLEIDRAAEFDAEARTATGFTPEKEAKAKVVTTEISKKALLAAASNAKAFASAQAGGLENLSDLERSVILGRRKTSDGNFIDLTEDEKLEVIKGALPKIKLKKPAYARLGDSNDVYGEEVVNGEQLLSTATQYYMEKEYKSTLDKIGYSDYLDYYKQAYGTGYIQTQSKQFSFGTKGDEITYKKELMTMLSNHLADPNVQMYNPSTGATYEVEEKEDISKKIKSKAEEGEIKLEDVKWRVDNNHGLVIDYKIDGQTIELRGVSEVVNFLHNHGMQDYALLKIIDSAAKTTVRTAGGDGVGEGKQYGYFGGEGSMYPKMMFKINDLPIKKNGVEYPPGSIELRVPQPDGTTKSVFFDNLYDAAVEGYLYENAQAQTMLNDQALFDAVIAGGERSASGSTSPSGNHFGVSQVSKDVINAYNQYTDNNFSYDEVRTNDALNKEVGNWYLNERIPEILNNLNVEVNAMTKVISYNAGPGNAAKWWRQFRDNPSSPEALEALKNIKTVVNGKTTDNVYDYLVRVGIIGQ